MTTILEKDCGEPRILSNAAIEYAASTFGNTAKYTCKDGYKEVGENHIVRCKTNGNWSEPGITCEGTIYIYIKCCGFIHMICFCFVERMIKWEKMP